VRRNCQIRGMLSVAASIFIFLWPPCVADADIILSSCGFKFFFFVSSFLPRLITAVAEWMSTILLHMVWP